MRIKSYFADSVEAAIEKARTELGPDAMLMNSKKTDFELRSLGVYEVVFGVVSEPAAGPAARGSKAAKATGTSSPAKPWLGSEAESEAGGELSKELAELRQQIETVKRAVARQQRALPNQPATHPNPGATDLCARLMAADFSEEIAQEIAEASELRAFAGRQPGAHPWRDFQMVPSELLEMALRSELDRRIKTAPDLGIAASGTRIVVLAGPSGGGKTTALAKLCLRYGLRAGLPLHVVSLDTLRVSGWEQLASYARIAGVDFDAVHNWNALGQLLAEHRNKKLVFIDTPGIAPSDLRGMSELAECCSRSGVLDVHFVCPATFRATTAYRLMDRFQALRPSKLLITHTDEASSPGSLLELAIRSGLPISYLSTGPNIPEDIQEACKEDLISSIAVWKRPAAASAA